MIPSDINWHSEIGSKPQEDEDEKEEDTTAEFDPEEDGEFMRIRWAWRKGWLGKSWKITQFSQQQCCKTEMNRPTGNPKFVRALDGFSIFI